MHRFFPTIIAPILERMNPKTMIEIGCADGAHTHLLLDDCTKKKGILHVVDPEPTFDIDALVEKHPANLVFHRKMSIDALPSLPKADIVLIDGDHNYFTVSHELAILCADPETMPVILLHDVGWPYGRRDMYHNPALIPEAERQPNERRGILVDGSDLAEYGHGAGKIFHACHEGGPKNGVLTAVEDALQTVNPAPRLVLVPGFHGLGIIAPERTKKTDPQLWSFLDLLTVSEPMLAQIRAIEEQRITACYNYEREALLHARLLEEEKKSTQG